MPIPGPDAVPMEGPCGEAEALLAALAGASHAGVGRANVRTRGPSNLKNAAKTSSQHPPSPASPLPHPDLQDIYRILVEQITHLNGSIAEVETRIEEEGEQLSGHKNLTSIKGIGSLSATVLLTAIGPIQDFADENKLAAYFGLVPKVQNSNESERSGRITKRGNKLAGTALVQCGLVAQRYSPYLKRFYERIKQRRGGGKAKIALARKLVKIVHDTLKNDWVFADFPSFTLAA